MFLLYFFGLTSMRVSALFFSLTSSCVAAVSKENIAQEAATYSETHESASTPPCYAPVEPRSISKGREGGKPAFDVARDSMEGGKVLHQEHHTLYCSRIQCPAG